ncbi:hypothetical protein [Trichoplusia ni ascovirus 2c]|uniref:hypothetical protein n=1 Tax=Trichoplusia ni ascovirus 2c TaxID=328615 RepID=UPI0000E44230|nr:hypothetical protein TNAV2c_gp088 [Trichoplusia ni ascovirus 2c]ABF70605.1 hypothetical protein [Trichoplusia ni ascovirus 2c]
MSKRTYMQLYNGLKYDRETLSFDSTLVCDSVQGRCGFMKRQPRFANRDSAYGSCEDNTMHVHKEHARDVITQTNGDDAFFKFSVKADMHTLGYYEWLVAKSMMLRCPHLPNFMRPFLLSRNAHLINHFCDSDDEEEDDDDDDDYDDDDNYHSSKRLKMNDNYEEKDSSKTKLRLKRAKIRINRNTSSYLDPHIDPFVVNYPNHYVNDRDLVISDVAVFEVVNGYSLRSSRLNESQLSSVTYQICMALLMAQSSNGFVHNDLHWKNILLVKCDPKLQIMYKYKKRYGDKSTITRLIPTHGNIPVIIDYGFAFCKELAVVGHNPEALYADHMGYITYETDECVDIVRTLVEYNTQFKLPIKVSQALSDLPTKDSRMYIGECSSYHKFEKNLNEELLNNHIFRKKTRDYLVGAVKRCMRIPIKDNLLKISYNDKQPMSFPSCVQNMTMAWKSLELNGNDTRVCLLRDTSDMIRKHMDPTICSEFLIKTYPHLDGKHLTAFSINMYNLARYSAKSLYECIKINRRSRRTIWKNIHSGEKLFMKVERYLHDISLIDKNGSNTTFTSNDNDPVLIVDGTQETFQYTTIGDIKKK